MQIQALFSKDEPSLEDFETVDFLDSAYIEENEFASGRIVLSYESEFLIGVFEAKASKSMKLHLLVDGEVRTYTGGRRQVTSFLLRDFVSIDLATGRYRFEIALVRS